MIVTARPGERNHGHGLRWRIVGWVAAIAALLLVFTAYRRPDMVVQMALQVWSCF